MWLNYSEQGRERCKMRSKQTRSLKALQAMVRNLDFLLMSDEEPLEDFQQGVICIV